MTYRQQLATVYANTATWWHVRWLERRTRSPYLWTLPLAIITSLLVG